MGWWINVVEYDIISDVHDVYVDDDDGDKLRRGSDVVHVEYSSYAVCVCLYLYMVIVCFMEIVIMGDGFFFLVSLKGIWCEYNFLRLYDYKGNTIYLNYKEPYYH